MGQSTIALAAGTAPRAMGSAHPLNAPYQAFEASDGWLAVGGANKKHWLLMLEALDATELAADPRFATGADRMAHLKELEAVLSERFRTGPRSHWLAALDDKGVPCGPVHDMLEALGGPQTLAREMVVEVQHSTLGPVRTIGLPVKFLETPGKVQSGATIYGEHTREVLAEHGFDDKQIAALETEGAIVSASGERSSDRRRATDKTNVERRCELRTRDRPTAAKHPQTTP
ncbi:CoA transferase [Bradyrhizobium sp. ISRA443]|uniref:CoA transferase n=1 Tax=unclassified Bradyrhizobium TaxID=2631580 RepID=UPI00247AEB01|nr:MULTISPECIES: CoA transferase [unclassified Bradyrhizobium]WGR98451.1 CoA transferase [Bradyrhizobium sp. ISRA436]WGS05340.1 CoA transferase [Bradyrhizobium sp. ISRA437]WGS12226.1 CoA transferase [Bradyrhizobium sp. ISRA443]